MKRFYQIINPDAIKPNIHTSVDGVPCDTSEWIKRGLICYDNLVGMKIGENQIEHKKVIFLRCGPQLFIPVFESGLKEISYSQFVRYYKKNACFSEERERIAVVFSPSVRLPIILDNRDGY